MDIGKRYSQNSVTNSYWMPSPTQYYEVIIGKRNGFGRDPATKPTPHPTLIGGMDPKVRVVGMLTIKDCKILSYDNMMLFRRENYIKKIRGFYNESDIIKVITGIRRCGK